jgi:hypothetical protein
VLCKYLPTLDRSFKMDCTVSSAEGAVASSAMITAWFRHQRLHLTKVNTKNDFELPPPAAQFNGVDKLYECEMVAAGTPHIGSGVRGLSQVSPPDKELTQMTR